MNTDLFQSCGHCWVFQIYWHIGYSTFTASSFKIWNSSTGISSHPLALFVVMLSKAYLTSHSRMSGSRWVWVITPNNTPKWCPFHYRGLECKSRKSRTSWSNRQIWPWITEWSRTKANRVLPRECTGHSKDSNNTRRLYPWTSADGQHQNQIDHILCSQRWRSSIQSAKTRPGANCGSSWSPYCQIQA